MYAIFRSPPRRTNNTAPFVQSTQKAWSPLASQCTICTNLRKMQKNSCNPCCGVVVCNRGQGKPNRPASRPRSCGTAPAGKSEGSFRAVYLVNWIGNRPPDRRTGKRAATVSHETIARQVKRERVTYCFTWNIIWKELILWNWQSETSKICAARICPLF